MTRITPQKKDYLILLVFFVGMVLILLTGR